MKPIHLPLRRIRAVGRALLDFTFPSKCTVCGAFFPGTVEADPSGVAAPPPQAFAAALTPFFCPRCRSDFTAWDGPHCCRCGRPIDNRGEWGPICDSCLKKPRQFHKVRAFGIYDGSLKTALHQLKYRSRTQLAGPLGRLLFSTFLQHWPEADIDLVIPVPLHPRKFRRRGFNQAFLLIRQWPELAAEMQIPVFQEMIQKSALKRVRDTDTQVGMKRSTRRTNIQNAFAVAGECDVREKKILLVDDVYTTGATADECARTLCRAGAGRVDVLTLAQTVQSR
ncbi:MULTISPECIES: ComF family protein [Desulfococcus]|uniref:Phosphoribosyltransferase n=1 Tax=Desulfococcus multivorans DSM 2059 TaxID=1121405 RepID=S7VJZ6_DESML|nr:ComF family protein [Desulfococcus multivorans]AOY59066.1 phosphoribosyltransferase [Desulfococcus multivorans]AQV01315.1 hypothetical protein B2D07_11440 [Desulfococcus multivorans]EPR44878.1 phosphoribosyltransferase [Desulfococcus multivorans DSM 2059]MDX9817995.1 ComF family protein [Desulfococcus multivorans]SJZ82428.1 comF family protein [Desulfococcus multivorans DSM 2059]